MPTNRALLVTRPNHDLITQYFHKWSEEVLHAAEKKNIKVYDLKGKKAVKSELESYALTQKPSLFFLNGHGNAYVIMGHDNEPIVNASSSLGEGIIYARSCDAGQALGALLIKNGAKTFIGYKRKFICGYSPDKITKPELDPIARIFLEPSNLVVLILIKGHTSQDAHNRSKEAMYKNFRKMISSAASYEERYAARWMWGNLNNQVLIGNPKSKI
ncbi:MAG: hypothetical protein UW30_C0015G0014 [Candidatus Giovannonibacteria bacterium GW2011_GWA2_44_13b]|uniref:Uncharacterized protein n=2 Tax=Candidatus Giovannoniibacteriota TaxID=1752738 RepID=A0A0G1H333_9BACT|nr:MAG: hypothetical protein UW30_C0015G0014 [Candidatus Giovannonibacteria bacterium GW2011_GWA2_44_13b]OGF82452.1 MAG: hypothetical protein A2924_01190 [Candidatus Giovannonibacteria bacterium RIFCSPLOWO2_01_FULL_44_16]